MKNMKSESGKILKTTIIKLSHQVIAYYSRIGWGLVCALVYVRTAVVGET